MASVWDLAVVWTGPDNQSAVQRFSVPGGREGMHLSAVGSWEDGAALLMKDGYEPFGVWAGEIHQPVMWFRREIKSFTVSGLFSRLPGLNR